MSRQFIVGDRVVTTDSLWNPTREMGYVTGTVAAVDDSDASAVLVDWDHQRIAYDRGSNFVYDWTSVSELSNINDRGPSSDAELRTATTRLLHAARGVLGNDALAASDSTDALHVLQLAEQLVARVHGLTASQARSV